MRFVAIFLLFIFLFGCSGQNLSTTDKGVLEKLHVQTQNVNQLIEELDLLLVEFQKNDELPEAIEMMETAKGETIKILDALKVLKTENNNLTVITSRYEMALNQYADGLQLQIDGMKNWNGQKTTEGFKQSELAKNDLKQYYEELKKRIK